MKYSKDEDILLIISYGAFFGGDVDIEFIKVNESFCKCKIVGGNGYSVDSEFLVSRNDLNRLVPTMKKICKWDDDYKNTYEIYDGFGWEIEIHMGDIDTCKHGYEAYPRNYKKVMKELIRFVDKLFKKSVPKEEYRPPLSPFMYNVTKFINKKETRDEPKEDYLEGRKYKAWKSQLSPGEPKTLQIPEFLKKE